MNVYDGVLLGLAVISSAIGLIILLVLADVLSLKKPSNIKTLYSALIVSVLLIIITFSSKYLFSDEHNNWLPSFDSSDSCNKPDRPFWCDLE